MTFTRKTLGIMTFSISINKTQIGSVVMLSVIFKLSVPNKPFRQSAEMLNVVLLSVVAPLYQLGYIVSFLSVRVGVGFEPLN
jgi:hypothetical protein